MKKKYLLLIILILFTGCTNKTKIVYDYVLDVGTYKKIDFKKAEQLNKETYDNWGGCSVVAKNINDNTIIGRNMDLTYSNKPAYIFKTNLKDKYKTINVAYTFRDLAPDYNDAINGLEDDFYNYLPFLSDDILNEEGLYIEINMRPAEEQFECTNTNKFSKERVYMSSLPIYIALNCKDIEEALEYVKTLDIYSKKGYWNFAFLLADSTGRIGVLEFAQNEIVWNEDERIQTNFYINEALREYSKLPSGIGRYNYLKDNIDKVNNKEDMLELMNDVKYTNTYSENPKFDIISEFVDSKPGWTYEYVTDPNNKEEIDNYINTVKKYFNSQTRKEKQEESLFWESTLTEIIDINNKTIKIRFFEDESKYVELSFNN